MAIHGVTSASPRELAEFPTSVKEVMAIFADKGLIISTGTFSRDARAEASRDGAPAIGLVDGQELAELLKKYTLRVRTVVVEKVEVDVEWFETI